MTQTENMEDAQSSSMRGNPNLRKKIQHSVITFPEKAGTLQ